MTSGWSSGTVSSKRRRFTFAKILGVVVGAVVTLAGFLFVITKVRKKTRGRGGQDDEEMLTENIGLRPILYDLDVLVAATDNFSSTNRLGFGGFGAVYKVKLLFFFYL